jgi:hypothetical protein
MRWLLLFPILAMSAQGAAQRAVNEPTPAGAPVNPKAIELFESDWVLMNWGLRQFDRDRDAQLSQAEATAGAQAFKAIADSDGNGRVTPVEFRRAREFLLARY